MSPQDSGTVPTAPSRSGVRRAYHPANGESYGRCDRCDQKYRDLDGLDRHMAREHPRTCSNTGCDHVASYRTARGSKLSGASYCVEHAPSSTDYWYAYEWVLEPANDHAPRLPDEHPLEQALRGLHGSREQAQKEKFPWVEQ